MADHLKTAGILKKTGFFRQKCICNGKGGKAGPEKALETGIRPNSF